MAHRPPSALESSVLGAVAGAVTGAVTTPLDVVKTRLMVEGGKTQYRGGAWAALTTIAREEGVSALFRGVQPRVVWIGVGGSIFFGSLELAKKALGVSD